MTLHIIAALKCEAKPLIAHYQLKKCADSPFFPIYLNQNKQISLTISGIGKINAAAATAFTHAFLHTDDRALWSNIGIAGHRDIESGTLIIAHKIIEQASQQVWYPQLIGIFPTTSMTVLSCDQPNTDYRDDTVVEMEAAGFYATASRFATSELIHVIKIISDNQQQPADKIAASTVSTLITDKLVIIDQILQSLNTLAQQLENSDQVPEYYEYIINQWRFTQAQRNMLHSCLNRWQVLCPKQDPIILLKQALNAADVLAKITQQLDSHAIVF